MQPKQPKAETQAMSEYGEPWRCDFTFEDGWIRGVGNYRLLERGLHGSEIHAERAVACVNALAGIPNPEAVRELVEAAKAWQATSWTDGNWAATCLGAAIAKLDAAPSASPQQK